MKLRSAEALDHLAAAFAIGTRVAIDPAGAAAHSADVFTGAGVPAGASSPGAISGGSFGEPAKTIDELGSYQRPELPSKERSFCPHYTRLLQWR